MKARRGDKRIGLPMGLFWRRDAIWMRSPFSGRSRPIGTSDPHVAAARFLRLCEAARLAERYGPGPILFRIEFDLPLQLELDAGYVYFLRSPSGVVKIGRTNNPGKRMKMLQTGSPVPFLPMLVVNGGREIEEAMHERFRYLREHGEWFRNEGDLKSFLERASSS